ncbi:IniB N-terminal domain-containing protein, partial [Pseudonocardia asaccharolytica]|uniref:IniB N-terminal domain-containing protein n=1 Tax=Pseudonocardia asaccharolytica TaxID=54010 RepID=UPI001C99282F
MSAPNSLIQMILDLLGGNPQAVAAFEEDPEGFLANCGFDSLTPQDVHDALVLIEDNQNGSFDREFNTGGNHIQLPPPPPAPKPAPGESNH